MRVLLATLGTAGDVHPFLAVAQELTRRGHEVAIATEERAFPACQRAGVTPLALVPDGVAAAPPPVSAIAYLRRWIVPRVPAMHERMVRHLRDMRADALLCHHVCLGVPSAAAATGVPWGMAAVGPASWPSLDQITVYPGMPDLDTYSPLLVRAGFAVGTRVVSALIDGSLSRVRRRMGLAPVRHAMFDLMFSGRSNLGLWSPLLRPPARDDRPNSRICGFAMHDDPAQDDGWAEVERALADDAPPIVFSLGSAMVGCGVRLLRAAEEACRTLKRRGLVLLGNLPGGRVPSVSNRRSLLTVRYAPHSRAFSHAAAVVIHGGVGTLAQGLLAGVPILTIPTGHDQFDNAARARRLGVGFTLPRSRLTGRGLTAALRRLLDDPGFRARAGAIAPAVRSEQGARAAAEAVEALAH